MLTLPPMADVLPGGPYGRLGLVTNDLPMGWCPHAEMANWEVLPRSLMPAYVVVMGESMGHRRAPRKYFRSGAPGRDRTADALA